MMKLLREWGFPVGLLMLWAIAIGYTLNALIGVQSTLESTQLPVMAAAPIVIEVPNTSHPS